jgi:hypothetical protein
MKKFITDFGTTMVRLNQIVDGHVGKKNIYKQISLTTILKILYNNQRFLTSERHQYLRSFRGWYFR